MMFVFKDSIEDARSKRITFGWASLFAIFFSSFLHFFVWIMLVSELLSSSCLFLVEFFLYKSWGVYAMWVIMAKLLVCIWYKWVNDKKMESLIRSPRLDSIWDYLRKGCMLGCQINNLKSITWRKWGSLKKLYLLNEINPCMFFNR